MYVFVNACCFMVALLYFISTCYFLRQLLCMSVYIANTVSGLEAPFQGLQSSTSTETKG